MFQSSRSVAKKATKLLLNKYVLGAAVAAPVAYSSWSPATSYFRNTMTAHAGWIPHPDFPAPKNLAEAIRYNDYPPGFTEPIPDYSNSPPIGVKKIVAANFEEMVLDPTKDVFVQFSQENCTSCNSFARILDALAFAFRDDPNIVFLEMKGTKNYIPGVLTSEEEVLFPTFKFFPAGQEKREEYQQTKAFVKQVREYNETILQENDPDGPIPASLSKPLVDKSTFKGCGYSMPMSMGSQDQYVWQLFVDVLYDRSKNKFDKTKVGQQLEAIEPALKREISHTIRSSLPGYEVIGSLAPCGPQWDDFQDAMLRRGVGSTKVSEFYDSMSTIRQCVVARYPIETEFWKEMMRLSIHMSKTLESVKLAKSSQGLTPDQAHEFFVQYSQALQQRELEKLVDPIAAGAANVPKSE